MRCRTVASTVVVTLAVVGAFIPSILERYQYVPNYSVSWVSSMETTLQYGSCGIFDTCL